LTLSNVVAVPKSTTTTGAPKSSRAATILIDDPTGSLGDELLVGKKILEPFDLVLQGLLLLGQSGEILFAEPRLGNDQADLNPLHDIAVRLLARHRVAHR
jgi:hypothetical protein